MASGGGKFARGKGQRAEREVIKLLQPVINLVCNQLGHEAIELERNLMQSHKGGYDIVGLDWLALEVKHQETFHINDWWEQTKRQAGQSKSPVLFYRRNHAKWRVMMFGALPLSDGRKVTTPVDIPVEPFLVYFQHRLLQEMQK